MIGEVEMYRLAMTCIETLRVNGGGGFAGKLCTTGWLAIVRQYSSKRSTHLSIEQLDLATVRYNPLPPPSMRHVF
jgi:hypothetical protein